MFISDTVAMTAATGAAGAIMYFIRWLTNDLKISIDNNTKAIEELTLIIEHCKRKDI